MATIEITLAQGLQMPLARLLSVMAHLKPHEREAAVLAFACNFVLLGSYDILKPLRDTMATIYGVADLQHLFIGTFILIFLCSLLFSWFAARAALSRRGRGQVLSRRSNIRYRRYKNPGVPEFRPQRTS